MLKVDLEFKFVPDIRENYCEKDLEIYKEYCELQDIYDSIEFIATYFKDSYTDEIQNFKYNTIGYKMIKLNEKLSEDFKKKWLEKIMQHRNNNEKLLLNTYFDCMNKINKYKNGGNSNEEQEEINSKTDSNTSS